MIEGLAEWEEEEAAKRRAEWDALSERVRIKTEAERARHIALGWITEDGEPGPNAPTDEEDDEEEDTED